MRTIRPWLLGLVAVCLLDATASAQDLELTKDNYPQKLVSRPLVLAPEMIEVSLGGHSDFVAAQSDSRLVTSLTAIYAPAVRIQAGIDVDLLAASDSSDFADSYDADLFLDYNLMPSFSARGSLYVRDLGVGDAAVGFRLGMPFKARLSEAAAVVSLPRYGRDLSGDLKLQSLEIPLGIQLQAISQLAFFVETGFSVVDFEFDNERMAIPLGVGALLTPVRTFDVGVELQFPDLTGPGMDVSGFDNRILLAWLALRR